MSFWVHWLLVCLCLTPIIGCVGRVIPDTRNLRFYEDSTLPNLAIARRVVPQVGREVRTFYKKSESVPVVSESRFGDPDEEPDLGCIYAGLREALPDIDIIPTTIFWEQFEAAQNVIGLPDLFAAPQSERLQSFQADVLVIAYHARIDLEFEMSETLWRGLYADKDKETAAIVVVDIDRKAIIHGSRITFEDIDLFAHNVFIIPLWAFSLAPSDICNTVARQAGSVISLTMPGRKIRALVVIAAEDPVAAADDHYDTEIRKNNDSVDPLLPN